MKKHPWFFGVLGLLSILVLALSPFVGMSIITPGELFGEGQREVSTIFWDIRIPRTLVGFMVGVMLSISGTAFQALFRNPLATPFTLGVSSGASLGAAVYYATGMGFSLFLIPGVNFFAFAGAFGVVLLVYGFTRMKKGFSTNTLLLAGVAIGLTTSSLILFVQYLSDFTSSYQIVHWLMGGVSVFGMADAYQLFPFAIVGTGLLVLLPLELNLLMTGEDLAASRGMETESVKKILFLAVSLMVAGVVSICGPIGFVGLMVPHICRQFVGFEHRALIPASILMGGSFLVVCDTVARTVIAPAEIPVGVITALLGGPFFLWLLLGHSRNEGWTGG